MARRRPRKKRARSDRSRPETRSSATAAARHERLEAERAAAAAERRRRVVGRALAAVLVVAALTAVVVSVVALSGGTGPRPSPEDFPPGSVPARQVADLRAAAAAADCTVSSLDSEGRGHVGDDPDYRSSPPHSGDHAAIASEDGAYSQAPRTGKVVHALEHGRVVYWFRPGAPASLKGALKALFDEDDRHVLLVPGDAEMPSEVAASAWTRVLGCPEANPRVFDALRAFRDAYRDKGPESTP